MTWNCPKAEGKKKVHSNKHTRQKLHHYLYCGCSYTTILYLLWHQIGWQICRFDIGHQGKKRHCGMCFLDKFHLFAVWCLLMSKENLWRSSGWEVTHSKTGFSTPPCTDSMCSTVQFVHNDAVGIVPISEYKFILYLGL